MERVAQIGKPIIAFIVFCMLTWGTIIVAYGESGIPPREADAKERLNKSPRHGEWVTYIAGKNDKVDAWVVYPQVKEKAPVVIVIQEIFGLSDWIRAVADQLAADGFIAIAPDLLSGKGPGGKGTKGLDNDAMRSLTFGLTPEEVTSRLDGAAKYATSLPAADKKYATIGFCWGGGTSFAYATKQPGLQASVVFYGTSPATETLKNVKASILGLYGGNDNRVNATIKAAEDELKKLGRSFEKAIFEGAGHGFLRQQDGQDGANLKASNAAWPLVISFLKKNLGVKTVYDGELEFQIIPASLAIVECCDEPHEN